MASSSRNQTKFTSKLHGKRVLILGGTSGIGFAVAEGALEYGAHVIISSSNPEKLEHAQRRLKEAYPDYADRVTGKTCDLSKPETLESNLKQLLEFAGKGVHHLVHTAGDRFSIVPVRESTPETLQKGSIVRFISPLMLAKLAPEYLAGGPESSITLTGGVNSTRPAPDWTVNASYGSGMEGMVRGLTIDLKPVRVNLVAPGAIETELWGSIPKEQRERMLETYTNATTVGRIGRPEDVAEAYLYCMKDHFVTGSVIQSEGGRILV